MSLEGTAGGSWGQATGWGQDLLWRGEGAARTGGQRVGQWMSMEWVGSCTPVKPGSGLMGGPVLFGCSSGAYAAPAGQATAGLAWPQAVQPEACGVVCYVAVEGEGGGLCGLGWTGAGVQAQVPATLYAAHW